MPSAFLTDLIVVNAPSMLSLSEGLSTSLIQVAKTGKFVSPKYGKFEISKADLRQMYQNFTTVTPVAPTRLPVDYDHLSMAPKTPGDGKAAGWFTGKMELRHDDTELWAEIEWTPAGAEAVRTKEYQFVSPSFAKNYTWKNGQKIGTTLLAAAITNHPFLEGMAAVTLSTNLGDLAIPDTAPAGQPARSGVTVMATYKMTATDGTEFEVDLSKMQQYCDEQMKAKNLRAVPEGDVLSLATFQEEKQSLVKQAQEIKDAAEAALAAATAAREAEKAAMETTIQNLSVKLDELSTALAAQKTTAEKERVEARITALKREGKISGRTEEWAKEYALSNPEGFETWAKVAPIIVKLDTVHGTDEDAKGDNESAQASEELVKLASQYAKANRCDLSTAMVAVSTEHPELAESYREGFDAVR